MKFNNKNIYIDPNCKIGKNVKIGDNSVIYENVEIGDNTIIANDCIIGEPINDYYHNEAYKNPKTIIGNNSLIRSHAIIYSGSIFGANFQTGHRVTIRENTIIGRNCVIGTNNDIQGECEIGDYCRFQSFVNVGQKSKIGNFVFLYPFVVLTNDLTPPCDDFYGVTVGDFAVISTATIIIAGKSIGRHSLIAANSVVNIDIPEDSFVAGNPSKILGKLSRMPFFSNGKRHYPWPNSFDRGMPWKENGYNEWLKKL